ncbi:siphovirus ReqiPepy6 Gp37-like family protein [Actinomadura litoris]|uniref:Gp28/Gp37-like domain-containing protein n=1 Tax=Actinomadura litoris TaxID=2678616 RepID=A0A7K1LAE9_9ACTN|nr:siphovirus ReqiPepy6 Gp37-like family protein [Actinomadura litoris]MUN41398.1 hypothetical protein [Actinomadura litoris]
MPVLPVGESPYTIEVRDADRARTGQIDRLTALELTPAFNDIGAWTLTMPAGTAQAARLVKGGWVNIMTGTQPVLAGQVLGLKKTRSNSETFDGTLTAYGSTAETILRVLAWPAPGLALGSQNVDYDRRTGAGETVIKQYVNLNAGPGALVDRRIPGLVIETDAGLGSTVIGAARMTPLVPDLIGPLATSAGLGFRVLFNAAGNLELQTYVPADRSASARFAIDLGNLTSYEHVEEAPKTSVAVVGGTGDGALRQYRQVIDTDAIADWHVRTETFVDSSSAASTDEMDQAGAQQLVNDGPVSSLTIEAIDTRELRFGRDYFLGDVVTVEGVTDVLRGLTVTWSVPDGLVRKSTVGTAAATGTRRLIKLLADLTAKVTAQQAKQ